MNRAQRRSFPKGSNIEKVEEDMKYLSSPVSITECVQIARGVAEDVLTDYNKKIQPLHVALSMQVEILRDILISKGIMTEEEFRKMYYEKVEQFNKMQEAQFKDTQTDGPEMSPKVNEIEITKL